MDAQQYEKIRKNLSLLYDNVNVMHIFPRLCETGTLDHDHKKELDSVTTDRSRIDRLLQILKSLPPDKQPYDSFLDALKKSGLPDYKDYAKTIEETSAVADASVRSRVDPSHCEDKVSQVLRENFANLEKQETSINEVRQVLVDSKGFTHTTWSNKELARFICDSAFVGVEKVKKKTSPTSNTLFFKHLGRIQPCSQAGANPGKSTSHTRDEDVVSDIQTLSSAELKAFLFKKFEEESLPTTPLHELEAEKISGKYFVTLNEEDMKSVMSSATFVHRRFLRLLIDEHRKLKEAKELNEVIPFEKFRTFDKEIRATDRYIFGRLVDTKINSRGKKTAPLRNFHLPEFDMESDVESFVLKECAKFAAACINDRQNGTVYFGISPDDTCGRRKGEIVGIQLSHGNLDSNIPAMFYAHKQSLIKSCVRNLKVVPVVGNENDKQLFVLELDVNPGMAVKEVESIRLDASGMRSLMKDCKVSDPIFSFSEGGKPRQMYLKETGGSTEIAPSVLEQRKIEETKTISRGRPNLIHLRNHLTGGLDKLDDDLYVFLLLSPFCESNVDVNNLEFIKHLQPSVLFDFDSNSEMSNSIYRSMEEKEEVVRVVTLNDFDKRQRDKKEIKAFQNELVDCEFANWVFCNGYGQMEKMEAIDWNKKRSHAFQTAFSHYVKRFQRDRILIIICLFSPQYKVMLDPCNEILSGFPDQWILLSETQSIADAWQGTFKQREKVDTKDLRERCIIGLSWEQVNTGITDWCGKKDSNECKIPESSGCLIEVENKKIKEWTDVEVLSALNPIDTNDDEENTTALIKAAEEEFYRGGQVSWLNFFSDHVCRRKIHQPLQKLVEDALEGTSNDDYERILTTYLFHEPGAGGSTSARHILWCLRQKYRCCVVREINNPSQTADQLTEIFLHRDKSPKPLLVLLDNEDEDKVFQLRVNLEKKARECDEQISDVFCVLLICSRMFDVPIRKRNSSMEVLKQSLEKEDRIWFEQRYKDLTKRYENPKSLISFNILKENFNKDYIKNTVKEFLDEIKDTRELTILKIVSFINNYDLDFKPIHASCFDSILNARPVHRSNDNGTRKARWEANVSQSFKVLLNMSSKDDAKKMKRIRLFTKHTAQHILNCLREKSGESVSDILISLLTDKIFSATDQEMKKFQNIISNLVKKRALKEFGFRKGQSPSLFRKEKFSPLILDIKENENSDIAGQMMEDLFELNSDPFTAQQVARFYIECKNYKKAEKYAKEATALLPRNSYMWDTYAQVFKDQLHDKFQSKCQIVDGEFSEEDLKEIIYICQTCTKLFRKEQSVSEKEAISGNAEINRAGYFGELRSILIMLSSIEKCNCFESKEIVHRFLVDRVYTNERLHFLSEGEMNYLKSLWNYSKDTVRKLGDEFLQTKVEIEANPLSSSHDDSRKTLLRLHVSLNEYFGESSDSTYLHENDKNHYRYRVVFSKNCHTLDKCLELKHSKDFDVITECYRLILENVKSGDSTVDDIKILLDIVTVLVTEAGRNAILRIKFQDIIHWSKDLYQRATREDYRRLEIFLYFTLYNFPTDERLNCPSLASPQDLAKVLKNWKEFFNASKNLQRITHRETTLFFLGKGKPPHDIVYQKYLDRLMYGTDNNEKWQSSEVCKHLRLMSGILTEKGDHIDYQYKSKQGNQHWIRVKTTNRVKNKAWLQKRVYFYLGFSFSGLKAYGMSDTNPETRDPPTKAPNLTRNRHFSPGVAKSKQPVMSLRDLEQRKCILTCNINEKKAHCKPCDRLERDLEEVNNDIQEILGNYFN